MRISSIARIESSAARSIALVSLVCDEASALAASYCDRVVFLADGLVVDEIHAPRREQILEHMTRLQDLAAARNSQA